MVHLCMWDAPKAWHRKNPLVFTFWWIFEGLVGQTKNLLPEKCTFCFIVWPFWVFFWHALLYHIASVIPFSAYHDVQHLQLQSTHCFVNVVNFEWWYQGGCEVGLVLEKAKRTTIKKCVWWSGSRQDFGNARGAFVLNMIDSYIDWQDLWIEKSKVEEEFTL